MLVEREGTESPQPLSGTVKGDICQYSLGLVPPMYAPKLPLIDAEKGIVPTLFKIGIFTNTLPFARLTESNWLPAWVENIGMPAFGSIWAIAAVAAKRKQR